jgi:hypothetical protein
VSIWTPQGSDPTRIDIASDPLERRINGVAYHGNTPFDVPYMSQIDGSLWVGGCTDGLELPDFIMHVISLYPWESYAYHDQVKSVLSFRMYDSADQGTNEVRRIAQWVNDCRAEGMTLVHCQAGLNRSNLVAATALILDGMEPAKAIALLREKRSPAVLCNTSFEAHLLAA